MAKDDLLSKIFGVTPAPGLPTVRLSKLYGLGEPPPARLPIPNYSPVRPLIGVPTSPIPMPNQRSSIGSLIGVPTLQPAVPVPAPRGIRFLDSYFSEPTALGAAWLPMLPGLYAILVLDLSRTPRPYRPIYFGKAEDLAARVVRSHEKCDEWRRAAGTGTLYVAYDSMPNTSNWERASVEERLIKYYAPECNRTFNPFGGLLGY